MVMYSYRVKNVQLSCEKCTVIMCCGRLRERTWTVLCIKMKLFLSFIFMLHVRSENMNFQLSCERW